MIATMTASLRGNSPFRPRRAPLGRLLVLLLLLPGLGGCLSDRENTISRTARIREIEGERVIADRVQRELAVLRQIADDGRDSIADAKARSIQVSSELRAVLAQLDHQLVTLRAAEQDLAAAKERAGVIQQELQPLRELEGQLAERQRRQQELAAQLAALEPQVVAAERAVAEKQAELQPKVQALQEQLTALGKLEQAIAAAQAAAGAVAPPAVPPAAPAEQPAKK